MTETLVHEGIDILSKPKYFGSKEKLLDEAVRTLLEVKPALRSHDKSAFYFEIIMGIRDFDKGRS